MKTIGSKKISKIKFYAVRRDVKLAKELGTYKSSDVAAKHHISITTVQRINNAKTWPGFVLQNQAHNTLVARKHADKFEREQTSLAIDTSVEEVPPEPQHHFVTYPEYEGLYNEVRRLRQRIEALEAPKSPAKRHLFGSRR